MSAGRDTKIFGGLGSISLHDLIQLLGMNGRTATLVLGRQGRKGKIYFKNGNVIHAFTGEIEGQDAFTELLRWEDADFIIEDGVPTLPKVTITESAVGLMLSTLTRLDEDSRETPAVGTPIPQGVSEGPPPRPPGSVRVGARVRRPVSGAVITVPEKQASSFPILPIAAVLVLLGAAGSTWWFLDTRSAEPLAAAAGAAPAPTAPPPSLPAEPVAPEQSAPPPDAEGATPSPDAAPTPEPFGVLAVDLAANVELRVDGRPVPTGARRLPPGRHTLELIRPDVLGTQRETLVIEPGQTLRRAYSADEFGWLQVVVIPWAEVLVDGQSIGQTPMGKVKAAIGEHAVVLRHPEAGEKRQTVVIEKGETTLVRVTLQGVGE
jgi:hypothetical protein